MRELLAHIMLQQDEITGESQYSVGYQQALADIRELIEDELWEEGEYVEAE